MLKNKKINKSKVWGGRFSSTTDAKMLKFNSSIHFDKKLYLEDIQSSLAHAEMLAKQKIILKKDFLDIKRGLIKIKKEIENGQFIFKTELEDIHMNIESRLTEIVGDAGKKLHTARSRNDQVVTDLKMWVRGEIILIENLIKKLQKIIILQAEKNFDVLMPGFTHLQVAQPITFGHHMLAYVEMFGRDRSRLYDCKRRLNECPLGSAALAGTSYPIDRHFVAKKLNFDFPSKNSMDSVSSRDFGIEFISCLCLISNHISRISEELIMWSTESFNFVQLSETFTTGSSIMPQKRNPDAAELARGKSSRILGNFVTLISLFKGLPLTYSKDLQEDKEPIFDSSETIQLCLINLSGMMESLKLNKLAMLEALKKGNSTATDLADYLVTNLHFPFRDAHKIVGEIVLLAEEKNCRIDQLSLTELKNIEEKIDLNALKVLNPHTSVSKKTSYGGTSPRLVRKAINDAKKRYL